MSLHPHSDSLRLTPTLIYSAPDLLLFCHPDMFNKYCLAGTGYTRGVVVGLHRRWWIICDSSFILINILKHSYTFLHSKNTHIYTGTRSGANIAIFKNKHLLISIFAVFFWWLPSQPGGQIDCQRGGRPPQRDSPFNHSAQKQQNMPL